MADLGWLSGRLAVVTGAGGGIGRAISRRLLRHGANVLAAGRRAAPLERLREETTEEDGRLETVTCDVSTEEGVLRLFERADALGGPAVLVNNAGQGEAATAAETGTGMYDRLMAANARSVFLCSREAMRRMIPGGGRIVNVASAAGLKGFPTETAYCASKHAALGMAKVMGMEGQANGIVVQTLCTTGVDTGMVRVFRPDADAATLISPEEAADAVEFLLSQNGNAYTDVLTLRRAADIPYSL